MERDPWPDASVPVNKLALATAAASYAYALFHDYSKPLNVLDIVSTVLCPPQFIFFMCIDCETGWGGFTMYSIVGVLNIALYALIVKSVSYSRKSD